MTTTITRIQTTLFLVPLALGAFFGFSMHAHAMTEAEHVSNMEAQVAIIEQIFALVPQNAVLGESTSTVPRAKIQLKTPMTKVVDCVKKDPITGVTTFVGCPKGLTGSTTAQRIEFLKTRVTFFEKRIAEFKKRIAELSSPSYSQGAYTGSGGSYSQGAYSGSGSGYSQSSYYSQGTYSGSGAGYSQSSYTTR